jgi:biotin carboxyl carrier protein
LVILYGKANPPVRPFDHSKRTLTLGYENAVMEKQSFTVTVAGKEKHKVVFDHKDAWTGTIDEKPFACDVISPESKRFHVLRDNRSYEVEIVEADTVAKTMLVKVNGRSYPLAIADKFDELLHSMGLDKAATAKVNDLKAPMPGLVLNVVVEEGQQIKKGDPVIVLEAMKMENILKSPADVTVKKIAVKKGVAVEKGQILVQFT